MLIGSPPCTPFSRVQFFNCNRGDPATKEENLQQAIEHVNFCIKLYRIQMKKGLYFLHEHPCGADSWELPEVQKLMEDERVLVVRSDMCAFGLKTWAENKTEE